MIRIRWFWLQPRLRSADVKSLNIQIMTSGAARPREIFLGFPPVLLTRAPDCLPFRHSGFLSSSKAFSYSCFNSFPQSVPSTWVSIPSPACIDAYLILIQPLDLTPIVILMWRSSSISLTPGAPSQQRVPPIPPHPTRQHKTKGLSTYTWAHVLTASHPGCWTWTSYSPSLSLTFHIFKWT